MAGLKKKVDVYCYRPFPLGVTRFAGQCNGIILDTDAIQVCLENKAMVHEVLKNGKRVPLDFTNFNVKNPMGFDIDNEIAEDQGYNGYAIQNIGPSGKKLEDTQVASKINDQYFAASINPQKPVEDNTPKVEADKPIETVIVPQKIEEYRKDPKAPEVTSISTKEEVKKDAIKNSNENNNDKDKKDEKNNNNSFNNKNDKKNHK